MFRIDGAAPGGFPTPIYIRNADGNLQQYTAGDLQTLFSSIVRYYAANVTGDKIEYALSTSATNSRGSGMVNTDYTSVTGNYQTNQVGDTYYAQEFPNGTLSTITTTYLTCFRA